MGDYILNTKLSGTPAAENAYLYNLDGTKQAISVTIKSYSNGLSGKLRAVTLCPSSPPTIKSRASQSSRPN